MWRHVTIESIFTNREQYSFVERITFNLLNHFIQAYAVLDTLPSLLVTQDWLDFQIVYCNMW